MVKIHFLVLVFILGPCVQGLKLLLVFPLPARSHYILGNELGKGLALQGHEVTMLSSFEEKNPPKGYEEILLHELTDRQRLFSGSGQPNMFQMENASPYFQAIFLTKIGDMFSDAFFNHSTVQTLLNSERKFDVVIVEQFWNDAMKYLAHKFDAHLVAFSTIGPNRWVNNLVGNPENPSYIPDLLLSFHSDMTFLERSYNLVFGLLNDLMLYHYFYPQQDAILHKYFPEAPELDEIQYNVSLVLTNGHESIHPAVPHVPNMIDIGGFHVNPPEKLPKDLKEFLDGATDGVIYFSLGSNLKPSQMPQEKKDILLKVLGARKERVLWKWDEDQLEGQPSNVKTSKWFPQQAILAHPNCKLFISHGGLLSLTETVYLGVPVLAFPIFGDQKLNAARIRDKKFGLALTFSQITEENLIEALDELLSNPSYRENARKCSDILHDRPMKPIQMADYWIRYVVKHKGAPHLRVAAIKLPLYKYYMLDLLAVGLICLGWVGLVIGYLTIKVVRLCCCKGRSKRDKKKND
ncbi:UDP-glycosyltransferase UGT5-like [Anthonomus grandis grandis]|uniref:UDP-glycosyltransferase UGT5-like n=1 Tax=Anthonomus grandis grandis TaxID=2921223 RepID=UPI0021664708|nr:UDP-glycosyltransferase UGT5-like [Anthonomus grandis grandis]